MNPFARNEKILSTAMRPRKEIEDEAGEYDPDCDNVAVRLRLLIDEFTFRLNFGNVKRHTLLRLDSFVDSVAGKRITYKELIAE